MSEVLVLGGAGYIGSHMVKALANRDHTVTVFDNYSNGRRDLSHYARMVEGDLRNPTHLHDLFAGATFDAVMHFAALCYVGESVQQPQRYFDNNVTGTLNLLEGMRAADVKRLVFSSTCSTYGEPVRSPIDEEHPQKPVNPYGETKLTAERAMAEQRKTGLRTVSLRYFNAAGCDPEGELGEEHDPETHLIPLVLAEALRLRAGGKPGETGLVVNGEDFPTPDGTCVRDYVHVSDLCDAHMLALDRLMKGSGGGFDAFNLGNEKGHSVKEVIQTCREVTGMEIRYKVGPRRPGDPAALVADSRKARKTLGWTPRYEKLSDIVGTAWNWFSARKPS